jgi:crotonobetainyl-CoA:carnitine CoA-transferase CaiB-like acyl-CoA transferase
MSKAMEGIVVLDLSQVYQGPYAGLLMAYHGAKVIKIEGLNGEAIRQRVSNKSPHEFLMFNSNKLGMTLDLKSKEGIDIFLNLVEKADVVIENFTPGVMKRLGIDYEVLKEINPKLIYATATGYGLDGPYSDFPGMDLTVQAISGVMTTTGFPESPPVKAGPAVCDLLGGTHLFGGISMALYHRERTGKGQMVEVSMHDTVYPTLASPLAGYYERGDEIPDRTGNRHSGLRMAPYNVYPTIDGYIAIICVTERHWESLVKSIEREDLINAPGFENTVSRAKNMEVVDGIISSWTENKQKWWIAELLKKAHVPSAPVQSIAEVANDPHLLARKMIREVTHPIAGKTKVPGTPIKLSNSPLEEVTPAPLIGEHTEEILKEMIGFNNEEINEFKEKGIINNYTLKR